MSSFAALGLEPGLVAMLTEAGIASPFPVQEATIPDAIAGRDVCGRAPTGSGKTLAYGLAVLQTIPKAVSRAPKALILVPTRELAKQVADVLMPYGRAQRRWVTAFFGGAGMPRQISDLQRGVDIAVATPGRLTDLVERGAMTLSEVEFVVIDEADRMADMGFTPQVSWILDRCSPVRQTLLFSATLDGDVDQLIATYMNDPVFHELAGPDGEDDEDSVLKRARHVAVPTRHDSKFQDLAFVTEAAQRAIVFVKNRFATERVADALDELGVRAVAMHGGMTQGSRERALERWAEGGVKALVATDVAARGVHVAGVDLVVHLDPPQDQKDYIHRSGRTARAGAEGLVVNLQLRDQQRKSAAMFRRLGVEVEDTTAEEVRAVLQELAIRQPAPMAPKKVRGGARPARDFGDRSFDRAERPERAERPDRARSERFEPRSDRFEPRSDRFEPRSDRFEPRSDRFESRPERPAREVVPSAPRRVDGPRVVAPPVMHVEIPADLGDNEWLHQREDRPRSGERAASAATPRSFGDRSESERGRGDFPRNDRSSERPREDRPRFEGRSEGRSEGRPERPRFDGTRRDSSRPSAPREGGFREGGFREGGFREGASRDGGRSSAPRFEGSRHEGSRHEGSRHEGSRSEGSRFDRNDRSAHSPRSNRFESRDRAGSSDRSPSREFTDRLDVVERSGGERAPFRADGRRPWDAKPNRPERPEQSNRSAAAHASAGHEGRPAAVRVNEPRPEGKGPTPRFADSGEPLNRRARRALKFGHSEAGNE